MINDFLSSETEHSFEIILLLKLRPRLTTPLFQSQCCIKLIKEILLMNPLRRLIFEFNVKIDHGLYNAFDRAIYIVEMLNNPNRLIIIK